MRTAFDRELGFLGDEEESLEEVQKQRPSKRLQLRLDLLSLAGLALAMGAVLLGQTLGGGSLSALINGPAFVVVIGGTVGAVLLQVPFHTFRRALKRGLWVWWPPHSNRVAVLEKLIEWSLLARREGLIGLENRLDEETDEFAAKALQLLAQGSNPDEIRYALDIELSGREELELQAVRLFEAMGGYAPTISIIGAVLGLIHVMDHLEDPSGLGKGIASAFVALIYGVGLANLVFLPMANKIRAIVHQRTQSNEMIIEGAVAIAQGENPQRVAVRLHGFMVTE